MGFLTPNDSPANNTGRAIFIPNDRDWIALVTGALEALTFAGNFTPFGDVTPAEAAARFTTMFDDFCFQVGTVHMIGELIAYAGSASPDTARYLFCDGASVLRGDYPDLFAVIGTAYGSADSTHFNVPDLRGRSPAGVGTGTGLTAVTLGESYGEETHVLTVGELAQHSHSDTGHTHGEGTAIPTIINGGLEAPASSATPSVGTTGVGYANLGNTGSNDAHNTVGPRLGVNYLIVAAL